MKKSLMSVVVPTLNEENLVEKCLLSVKNQTYRNFELILSDNGSTDKTVKIAKKYCDKIVFEEKKGVAHAKNKGMESAKGDIIVLLEADTIISKNFLFEVYKNINGSAIGVTCPCGILELDGKFPLFMKFNNLLVSLSIKLKHPTIPGPNPIAIKREIVSKVKFKDKVFRDDLNFSLDAGRYGKFIYLPNCLAQTSIRKIAKKGLFNQHFRFITKDIPDIFRILGFYNNFHENAQAELWNQRYNKEY